MELLKALTTSFIIYIEVLLMFDVVCVVCIASDRCNRKGDTLYCTTIPQDIPEGVDSVYLQDVGQVQKLHRGTFAGKNWGNVILLELSRTPGNQTKPFISEIEPYAMKGLAKLKDFFILTDKLTLLHKESFVGLTSLKLLNFTGCPHLNFNIIIDAISGPDILPCLEVLSITYTSVTSDVVLGKDFFKAVSTKPIKMLDFHKISITSVYVGFVTGIQDTLQIVNVSGVTLDNFDLTDMNETRLVKQPKVLDISYTNLPKWMLWFVFYLPSLLDHSFTLDMANCGMMSNFEIIDFDGINSNDQEIRLHNITINLENTKEGKSNWRSKVIRARNNNLQYLDVTVPCKSSLIQTLDFSYNNMEYLRPDFCPCCLNLQDLDLSNNRLFLMAHRNFSIFNQLVRYFPNLTSIKLSANNLTIIPKHIFNYSVNLETIDLSINEFRGVHICLQGLPHLKLLNLQGNIIEILDDTSLANLQALAKHRHGQRNISEIVDLKNNPFSCASCDTLRSIEWLVNELKSGQLKCTNHEGNIVPIDKSALIYVQDLCDKPVRIRNRILLSTLIPVSTIVMILFFSYKLLKYRRRILNKRNMTERVRLIQENEKDTEYIVFLCFSSYDYCFVDKNVYKPLKQHLWQMIGIDRELVCMGDRNFQIGKPINDEIIRSIGNSDVVMLILSNNFCESEYCRMEFDHALLMRKPIVLMMKEDVSEDNMVPSLRAIFKNRTRIMWEKDGGLYQLKTTWENVCTSIVELIQD